MTLKKCPNCGSDAQIIKEEEFLTEDVTWTVRCSSWQCGNDTRSAVKAPTREAAEKLWGFGTAGLSTIRPQSLTDPEDCKLWGDICWHEDGWAMKVGTIDENHRPIVLEEKRGMRTEHNAETAMEAAYQRQLAAVEKEQKP